MKPKTLEKIMRRFQKLPLHCIDSSIILEAFDEKSKFRESCKNYLNKIGYNFRGILPISVIGEIFTIIETDIADKTQKEIFFQFFDSLVKNRKIGFAVPKKTTFQTAEKAKELENRIGATDVLNLSIAIDNEVNVFVTLDADMIHNKQLEKEFDIQTKAPYEF
ncbi:MAG: PIN domain-containing protein [Candidatus Aenigmarchaeota archaeon]|nr:PIN domain-containing protein [Candidatus Aenigmarchaeota archaeon]